MKLSTKIVGITASVALIVSLAAGCASGDVQPSGNPDATGTIGTPGPTISPVVTANLPKLDYIPEDVILECAGMPGDTVLLTVDGAGVTAEQVLYWVTYSADQYASYMGGALDFTADMGEGVSMGQYLLDNATQTAALYQVVKNHSAELGMGFNEENQKKYNEELATMKGQLASSMGAENQDEAYVQWLAGIGLSDAGFAAINEASYLFGNLKEGFFGDKGTKAPTDADLTAYMGESSSTLRAKHILVSAVPSEDGSDDGMAAALEKSNAIRAELKAAGDTEEIFDTLMAEKSEDPGSKSEPDGYTFGPGEMVTEFEEATKALAVGKVSEPVKSSFGYHIILRLAVDPETVKADYVNDKTNAMVDEWMAAAVVENTADFDKLDIEAFYTKLAALRTSIDAIVNPQPEETPAPTGTVPPTETIPAS